MHSAARPHALRHRRRLAKSHTSNVLEVALRWGNFEVGVGAALEFLYALWHIWVLPVQVAQERAQATSNLVCNCWFGFMCDLYLEDDICVVPAL